MLGKPAPDTFLNVSSQGELVSERSLFRLAWLLVFSGSAAFAQQFTADMVRLKPAGAVTTKVSFKANKVRMEVAKQTTPSYVILDLAEHTSTMVLPDTKTYVLSPPGHMPSSIPLVRVGNPDEACVDWKKDVDKSGECKKVGDEDLNGRKTVRYTAKASNGDPGTVWIDRELRVPIKWEAEKGAAEMQNIKVGPQPDDLFEIPKDFEKFNAGARRGPQKGRKTPPPAPRN
jgi:hypothetical protein